MQWALPCCVSTRANQRLLVQTLKLSCKLAAERNGAPHGLQDLQEPEMSVGNCSQLENFSSWQAQLVYASSSPRCCGVAAGTHEELCLSHV